VSASRAWESGDSRRRRRNRLLAAVGSFLLDPPEAVHGHALGGVPDPSGVGDGATPGPLAVAAARPIIAVFGLAGGCGSTVVSRAVAAELAARDASGTAAVSCDSRPGGLPLATKPAVRLARTLEDLPGGARALGRLCLLRAGDPSSLGDAVRGLAPLVIDAGSSALGGASACVADHTLIVTSPLVEPTLARVALECVARVGPEPTLVLNRARHSDAPEEALGDRGHPHALPESRLGAQLALGGREPRGELGRAVSRLVDSWEGGG
jgi:hypothetical protein